MKSFFKLNNILAILFLLNIIMYAMTANAEARNAYMEALKEVFQVAPKG